MPARSTLRQRVVFHVQRLLTPAGTVQESALLKDRISGALREVDIVIAARVGEHDVLVCIECIDRNRKATVEWVEQMAMKHQSLPTSKLVLVSTKGFTSSAALKATSLGIEAYSLDAAEKADWEGLIGSEFRVRPIAFRVLGCGLILASERNAEYPVGPDTAVFDNLGTPKGSLQEALHAGPLSSSALVRKAAEHSRHHGSLVVSGYLTTNSPWFVEDCDGMRHEVASFHLHLEFRETPAPTPLQAGRLHSSRIAYGVGASPLGEFAVTFLQTPAGPVGAISVANPVTGDVQTWDLQYTPAGGKTAFMTPALPNGSYKRED
jgi:hypothetical protein